MIDIRRAQGIEGWMGDAELTWLAHAASESYKILEIGVWCGRTTRVLADHTPGRVVAMDIWAGTDGVNHWGNRADELITRERALFDENLSDHIANGKVVPVRMDSVTWELGRGQAPLPPGLLDEFDMVFLDGLHTYEHLVAEIYLYRPRIMVGGILAGHDYNHPDPYGVEVRRAVDQMVGPVNVVDYIWWTRV